MCILGSQYQLYSRNVYKKFLDSIERLNYTNYSIIYIDDNSPDKTAYKVYDYIRNKNFTFKSKMKIIRTLYNIGGLPNIVLFSKKMCN